MAETEKNAEKILEDLLETINIISKKLVESISFDKTIEATVVDASKASEGAYTVSTGSSEFTAYSTETEYKEDDAVMVTIPQGDYDKQKMIIGKQVDKMNTPMIYKSPFLRLVNVSNNLIYGEYEISYWANRTTGIEGKCWDKDVPDFNNSSSYLETYEDENLVVKPVGLIWDSGTIFEKDFTRIGLSALFSTWLGTYNTITGNYGLALEITFKCVDIPDNAKDENQNPIPNTFKKIITFDSDEFFGDVYNFDTYYTQEALFNIEEFIEYPIVQLRLFAYLRNNFRNIDNEDIYINEPLNGLFNTGGFSSILPNIFIKDPYICLGIPVEDFDTDTATIITENSLFYTKELTNVSDPYNARKMANKKVLALRWIHKDINNDVIKAVLLNELPPDYEIRWYRYQLGATSPDLFAGAHWMRFYGCKDLPDNDGNWCLTYDEINNEPLVNDLATNYTQDINFYPNVNNQTEQLKVIVIKLESENIYRKIASSNIITFTNNTEIRNNATIIDMNELAIRFDDEQKGQYFLYNRAGKINSGLNAEIRTLTAVFQPDEYNVENKAVLTECSSIKWTFPFENTMIVPMTNDETPVEVSAELATNYFTKTGDSVNSLFTVKYRIKEDLNFTYSNNTVKLEINKDGAIYTANVLMLFGTAGSSGSDYTLRIEWVADSSNPYRAAVIDMSDSGTHQLIGNIFLYDLSGLHIEIPAAAGIESDWYVAEYGSTTSMDKEKEEAAFYYPVFKNTNNTLNIPAELNNTNNPDYGYLSGNYYYFIDDTDRGYLYYTFNPTSKEFITTDYNSGNILYRKVQNGETKKNKLEFKRVSFNSDIFNLETGELNTYTGNSIVISPPDATHDLYYKQYYYNSDLRYFLKVNDTYVIDPWTTYQEGETYYEPVEAKEVKYNTANSYISITTDLTAKLIILTANNTNIMNSIWVLRIKLTNFGDYPLVALFPIALKKSETGRINYINGPTFVRYSCDGETDFDKNPYNISTTNLSITNKQWRIICPNDDHEIVPINHNTITNTKDNFLPLLKQDLLGQILLSPPSVYVPLYRPYAVLCFLHDNSNDTDIVYWTQSILVYEDNYPSTTLNKWNGKEIITDEDNGTITANGFSAGKKESDNTFTGVVIGDWSRSDIDTAVAKNTGVYGFNHGSMSYAFKDDGTGFIGKDGKGRIFLDGDKSQIFSAYWVNRDNPEGMLLDIDDGYIKMQSKVGDTYTRVYQADAIPYFATEKWKYITPNEILEKAYTDALAQEEVENGAFYNSDITYYKNDMAQWDEKPTGFSESVKTYGIHVDSKLYIGLTNTEVGANEIYHNNLEYYTKTNNANYITLGSNQTRYPLSIGTNKSVLQRGFRVEWDGTTHINNGEFSGIINAKGGTISGDLTVTSTLNGGILRANELYVRRGEIGGWTIDGLRLYSGQTELSSSNGITTNAINISNSNPNVSGKLGALTGMSDEGLTNVLGLYSSTNSIVLLTAETIRVTSLKGTFLLPKTGSGVYIGTGVVTYGYTQGSLTIDAFPLNIVNKSGSNYLISTIPAANLFGIYARFA